MVATVVINQANVIQDGQNNKLVYNFPSSVAFPNHEIAVQSIVMYYSWQNINNYVVLTLLTIRQLFIGIIQAETL